MTNARECVYELFQDFSSYYQAGGCWSRLLNRNYVMANLTSTISWNLIGQQQYNTQS